jgi:hypothetical protein
VRREGAEKGTAQGAAASRERAAKVRLLCAACRRCLEPGEPVAFVRTRVAGAARPYRLPHCVGCIATTLWSALRWVPCLHCGRRLGSHRRRVQSEVGPAARTRRYCSERCYGRRVNARKRRLRARDAAILRMATCGECGSPFQGRRSDAETCSARCRQRRFRRRLGALRLRGRYIAYHDPEGRERHGEHPQACIGAMGR